MDLYQQSKSMAEDLSDLISQIDPTPTPLFPKSFSGLEQSIKHHANNTLKKLRDYRDKLMDLPDDGIGRPHSHGETDNPRGLRIRAVSIAITDMESAMKRFEDSTEVNLEEYYLKD